jgi:hypothetical protein
MKPKIILFAISLLVAAVMGLLIWRNSDTPEITARNALPLHSTKFRNRLPDTSTARNPRASKWDQTGEKDVHAALDDLYMDPEQRLTWLRGMIESDPARAMAWVKRRESGSERSEATRDLALIWAETDLKAALAWLQDLPDPERRQSAQSSVCAQLAGTDAPAALALAETIDLGSLKTSLVENLAAQWAAHDSEAAVAWAKAYPDLSARNRLLARLALALARDSPVIAANLVASELPNGPESASAAVAIVHHWGRQNPQAAGRWVAAFPEGRMRNEAASNLVGVWAEKDFEAAARWVSSLAHDSTYAAAQAALEQVSSRLLLPPL